MGDKKYWGGKEDRRNRTGYRGNSRKENQRLGIMKDLYGNERARLENEANQRPEQHVSEALQQILANSKMDDRLQFSDLLEEWETLVGEALATLCSPVAIDNRTLMIEVTHASAMHVLETYKKAEILKRVQEICKEINRIKFVPSNRKI
jgi:hypothetical protein